MQGHSWIHATYVLSVHDFLQWQILCIQFQRQRWLEGAFEGSCNCRQARWIYLIGNGTYKGKEIAVHWGSCLHQLTERRQQQSQSKKLQDRNETLNSDHCNNLEWNVGKILPCKMWMSTIPVEMCSVCPFQILVKHITQRYQNWSILTGAVPTHLIGQSSSYKGHPPCKGALPLASCKHLS